LYGRRRHRGLAQSRRLGRVGKDACYGAGSRPGRGRQGTGPTALTGNNDIVLSRRSFASALAPTFLPKVKNPGKVTIDGSLAGPNFLLATTARSSAATFHFLPAPTARSPLATIPRARNFREERPPLRLIGRHCQVKPRGMEREPESPAFLPLPTLKTLPATPLCGKPPSAYLTK